MSKHAVHHPPRKNPQGPLMNVVLLGPQLMAASLEEAGRFVRLTSHLISDLPAFKRSSCCCEIPETHCPPRCVCEIHWEASPGEHLKSTIRVTNASATHARNFQFNATSFQGPGNPSVPLAVAPPNATLQPGQSTFITAQFTPTAAFQPGETYHAEVLIQGAYEQCVCFQFTPIREGHAECEVAQGDPPTRLRAHQWYDHFQCSEPCFPARKG